MQFIVPEIPDPKPCPFCGAEWHRMQSDGRVIWAECSCGHSWSESSGDELPFDVPVLPQDRIRKAAARSMHA
jgi:ribosomal protein L37AE/L43A